MIEAAGTLLIQIIILVVIPVIGVFLKNKINEVTKVFVEEKHRNALNEAIATAIDGQLAGLSSTMITAEKGEIIEESLEYIKVSVKDAVKTLDANDDIIRKKIEAYIKRKLS